jgi:CheY-like chemotaxis protein
MMPGKRALVVDDSKSARVVLSRMLERYGILVDSADSAEAALEYLKDRRPDVIFMDHLMPGMDGLQAVREIKSKPDLASIPIMMYTSQEGEIYGGQARASGAVGVLPKSIRPIDVTKALYQLQLLPDRRDEEPSALEPAAPHAAREAASPAAVGQPAMEALLKEHDLDLRKFVVSTLDTWTHRIVAELRPRESPVDMDDEEALASSPLPPSRPWRWVLATFASLAALVFVGILYWQARVTAENTERAFQAVSASTRR